MSNLSDAVQLRLATSADLTALVDDRVWPITPPTDNPDLPFVLHTVTGSESTMSLDGTESLTKYTIDVDTYGINYDAVQALQLIVRGLLQDYRGGMIDGVTATSNSSTQTDTGYMGTQTFTVWANDSTSEQTASIAVGDDLVTLSACDHTVTLDCDGLKVDGELVQTGSELDLANYARLDIANTYAATQTVTDGTQYTSISPDTFIQASDESLVTESSAGQLRVYDTVAGSTTINPGTLTTNDGSGNTSTLSGGTLTVGTRGVENSIRLSGANTSWDWRLCTNTNGANGVDDHALFIGSNYQSSGLRQDASQASLHIGMENRYKPYPLADYNQSEWYIQYVLPGTSPTTTGRTYMTEIRHSGTTANRVTNSLWGNLAFRRVGDDQLNWYMTDSGILSSDFGRIDLGANNSQMIRQRMAAGGDNWITPFYIDNSDVMQLATASTGAFITVNHYGRLTVGRTMDLAHASIAASTPTLKITTHATALSSSAQYGLLMNDPGYGGYLKIGPRGTLTTNAEYVQRIDCTITAPSAGVFVSQYVPTISGNNAGSNHVLSDVNPTITTGTHTGTSYALYRAYPVATGGATAPDVRCYDIQSAAVSASSITALYGYRYRDTFTSGGSTIGTQYGVYVDDLTGAGTNYAIYTGKGQHRFGDSSASTKVGFFGATPVVQQSGNVATALANLGLVTSGTYSGSDITTGTVAAARLPATVVLTSAANAFTVGGQSITNNATGTVPLTITGIVSQTANALEVKSSTGTLYASIGGKQTLTANADTGLTVSVATALGSSGQTYGAQITNTGGSGTACTITGLATTCTQTATHTLAVANLSTTNTSAGTTSDAQCFRAQMSATGTGTVTQWYGLSVQTPFTSGSGSVGTAYGVKVEDQTGASTNYAWHSGKGQHRFGDSSASTLIGFYGATPVTKPTALTAANASALNTGDATSDTVIANMRTRINELETKLQALGLLA